MNTECSACQLRELDERSSEFLRTRSLSWWRGYWRECVRWLEFHLKRPATKDDKMAMLRYWRSSKSYGAGLSSSRTLAVMTYLFCFKKIEDTE